MLSGHDTSQQTQDHGLDLTQLLKNQTGQIQPSLINSSFNTLPPSSYPPPSVLPPKKRPFPELISNSQTDAKPQQQSNQVVHIQHKPFITRIYVQSNETKQCVSKRSTSPLSIQTNLNKLLNSSTTEH